MNNYFKYLLVVLAALILTGCAHHPRQYGYYQNNNAYSGSYGVVEQNYYDGGHYYRPGRETRVYRNTPQYNFRPEFNRRHEHEHNDRHDHYRGDFRSERRGPPAYQATGMHSYQDRGEHHHDRGRNNRVRDDDGRSGRGGRREHRDDD
ncbi:MAG: hypothetical protein ABL925_08285 [Methylococcales bacterium]